MCRREQMSFSQIYRRAPDYGGVSAPTTKGQPGDWAHVFLNRRALSGPAG